MATLETTIRQTHEWALDRIHLLADGYDIEDIEILLKNDGSDIKSNEK